MSIEFDGFKCIEIECNKCTVVVAVICKALIQWKSTVCIYDTIDDYILPEIVKQLTPKMESGIIINHLAYDIMNSNVISNHTKRKIIRMISDSVSNIQFDNDCNKLHTLLKCTLQKLFHVGTTMIDPITVAHVKLMNMLTDNYTTPEIPHPTLCGIISPITHDLKTHLEKFTVWHKICIRFIDQAFCNIQEIYQQLIESATKQLRDFNNVLNYLNYIQHKEVDPCYSLPRTVIYVHDVLYGMDFIYLDKLWSLHSRICDIGNSANTIEYDYSTHTYVVLERQQ